MLRFWTGFCFTVFICETEKLNNFTELSVWDENEGEDENDSGKREKEKEWSENCLRQQLLKTFYIVA